MAECECLLLAQFGLGQHFSGFLTGGGVHVEKDRLYLRSISYAIRGTNAVQKTTKQAEQSIRPTT